MISCAAGIRTGLAGVPSRPGYFVSGEGTRGLFRKKLGAAACRTALTGLEIATSLLPEHFSCIRGIRHGPVASYTSRPKGTSGPRKLWFGLSSRFLLTKIGVGEKLQARRFAPVAKITAPLVRRQPPHVRMRKVGYSGPPRYHFHVEVVSRRDWRTATQMRHLPPSWCLAQAGGLGRNCAVG